ncbi:peptide chain release factor N(5)-glutamine methyltransferase [Turneriella parva]|uniref:Release factor glutamine methyltransferase n=1 Tax=Turneriella parva (strain ATCC BAA-1111 / DSM 21527 / NCTC 11395 / H) TaxID=869212 RepID=I4B6Y6_TURPD|nr:peptide chain release factor N(5)-glutamine methyltransferase [Turneriella parva]AFM13043.1 protein-(glutamine-N5) methyltransferase, release factor-specific [Turneriella parva DSM 21527]
MSSNTLIEILRKGEAFLAQKLVASPRLEAQLIFAHFLKLRRIDLFLQPDRPLTPPELETLREALKKKAAGFPTAHILGEKEFYGRPFSVSADVLIPRPETEELVEHVLAEIKEANHIVDLGTGSGCIGLTLALELKAPHLTLIDISEPALKVAKHNADALLAGADTKYEILNADFTSGAVRLHPHADVIVSNPPYVLPEEFAALDAGVRDCEPRVALVADDFEEVHRRLIDCAFGNLAPAGLLAIETHPRYSQQVADWALGHGFVRVEVRNDLAARPHFVFAWR